MQYIAFGKVYGKPDSVKKQNQREEPIESPVSSDYCLDQETETSNCSGPG